MKCRLNSYNLELKFRTFLKHALFSTFVTLNFLVSAQFTNLKESAFEKLSVKKGLPSSEVFHVVEDHTGYLWFATDNGLSKYNGVSHVIYDQKSGLKNASIIRLFLQKDSSIVGIDLNDELFRLKNGVVTYLVPNDSLKKYSKRIGSPMSFYEDAKGNYHIGYRRGYLIFNKDGEKLDLDLPSLDYHLNSFETYGNQYFSYFFSPSPKHNDHREIKLFRGEKSIGLIDERKTEISRSFYTSGAKNVTIFYVGRNLYVVKNDKVFFKAQLPNDLITSTVHENQIFIGTKDGGLYHYIIHNERVELENHFFPNLSVSSILISSEGNIWCSTLEDGVRVKYFSNLIKIFESEIHEKITCFFTSKGLLKVGFENGDIKLLPQSLTVNIKSKVYLFKAFKGKQIAASSLHPVIFDSPSSTNFEPLIISGKNNGFADFTFANDSTVLLFDRSDGLSEWEIWKDTYSKSKFMTSKIVTFKSHQNNIYVSSEGLVQTLDNENYNVIASIEQSDPIFYFFKRNKKLSGVTSNTLLNINSNSLDTVFTFPTEAIVSAYFKNRILHLSTAKGVYSWSLKEAIPKLIGYESIPDIQSIQVDNDTLFFASKKSIYKKAIADLNCSAPQISIPGIMVNGANYRSESIPLLPYGEIDIQVPIEAILRKKGEIEYRYRLAGRSRYTYTTDRTINLSSLSPGKYQLEVSATINGVIFSPPKYVQFNIDQPYWLKWPFILIVSLTILAVSGFTIRLRIVRLNRKHQLEAAMVQLKSEALSSQLNPHLLFNIMNSIQGLVAEVDVEKANIYIARFSTFLRNCLEYSCVQQIPNRSSCTQLAPQDTIYRYHRVIPVWSCRQTSVCFGTRLVPVDLLHLACR